MENRISREELVAMYQVEIAFFDSLEEAGLLITENENNVKYLRYEHLGAFERFANWHYDLEVNLPGLEIIYELLRKLEEVQSENRKLTHLSSDDYFN